MGNSGFIGVDVFFVISGYLITSIIVTQLDAKSFKLKTFYINRIRRLTPALFVTLILVTLAGSFWLFPLEFEGLIAQVLAAQFYGANFYYWLNVNYFGLNAENVLLLHTWSLAVEEQFYLLYPITILLAHRYLKRYLPAIIAAGLMLSFALNIFFVGEKPEAAFYLLPTRAWELFAGALIHFLNINWVKSRISLRFLGISGLVLILLAILIFDDETHFPGFFALLPTLGAVCLIISGNCAKAPTTRLLGLSPVVYIGKISYPLYLVHWPINVFAGMYVGSDYSLPWRVLAFFVSFLLSAIIYHVVESPIRYRRILATDNRLTRGYLAALAVTLLMFAAVEATGGLPTRFPDNVVRLANYANDKNYDELGCEFSGGDIIDRGSLCRMGMPGVKPSWLIYGDSHAWAGYAAFDSWLKASEQAGFFVFRNSCPPIRGIYLFRGKKGICFAFNEAVSKFLESDQAIQNVILVSTWRQVIEARLSRSNESKLSVDESLTLFSQRFEETLKYLHSLNKKIYVWAPVPGAREKVPYALARAAMTNRPTNIEIGRQEYLSTYEFFFEAIAKNRHLITQTFSPWETLCKSGKCAVTINGVPAYFDNGHITSSTADFWAEILDRQYQMNLGD